MAFRPSKVRAVASHPAFPHLPLTTAGKMRRRYDRRIPPLLDGVGCIRCRRLPLIRRFRVHGHARKARSGGGFWRRAGRAGRTGCDGWQRKAWHRAVARRGGVGARQFFAPKQREVMSVCSVMSLCSGHPTPHRLPDPTQTHWTGHTTHARNQDHTTWRAPAAPRNSTRLDSTRLPSGTLKAVRRAM